MNPDRASIVSCAMLPRVNAPATTTSERPRSRLVQVGDAAMRAELLSALEAADWNLSAAARTCGLSSPSNVLRMIPRLNLAAEYNEAKRDGRIKSGPRRR